MNKNLFIVLGVIVALLPFVSIPNSFKTPIYIILGASIAIVSYRERYMKKKLIGFSASRRFKKVPASTLISNDISVNPTPLDETAINNKDQ